MYRKFLRPGWIVGHLLVVVAVLVCLRLGLWQWHRTHEATGTVQNLGYTILWPVFGAAFIYMWVRFLQLEVTKDAEDDAELTAMAAGDGSEAGSIRSDDVTIDSVGADEPQEEGPAVVSGAAMQTDLTPTEVLSDEAARMVDQPLSSDAAAADESSASATGAVPGVARRPPSRGYTVAVSTVGDDNEDEDPELAAYNRALAALAEKDHRRAR